MRSIPRLFAALLIVSPLPMLATARAATPAALQAADSPTMPAPDGGAMGGRVGGKGGGKLAGFFTPEQRAMYTLQMRDQFKTMAPDQKKAFRQQQVRKIVAMSPADRQKMKADLQSQWDALPAARKQQIEQRLANNTSAAQ